MLVLKLGFNRMQPWIPYFNSQNQRPTNAQVWFHIHDLRKEYYHPKILRNIVRAIVHLLKINNATLQMDLGHYARIMIDVDLSKLL